MVAASSWRPISAKEITAIAGTEGPTAAQTAVPCHLVAVGRHRALEVAALPGDLGGEVE